MKTKKDIIEALVASLLPGHNAYLVDFSTRGDQGETVVQILADTDAGITIGQCARLSRDIAQRMEESGVYEGRYRLEVSSPGLDKPLKVLRQYQKNVGRKFSVTYRQGDEEKQVTATLTGVDGEMIEAETEDSTKLRIPFGQITLCRYQLPW